MFIYKIKNKINNKVYIGQTIQEIDIRFYEHIKSSKREKNNTVLYKAMRKYGIHSFEISIVDIADNKKVLNEKEKYWIRHYNAMIPNGYNMTEGGYGGDLSKYRKDYSCSEKTKQKLREINLGKIIPIEIREKISNALKGKNLGKRRGEEVKNKLSESHKGLPSNNKGKKFPYKPRKPRLDMLGDNNPAKRPEVRKKLSQNNAMKNPEQRKKCKGNLGEKYQYKSRPKAKGRMAWNKGLTKETDERVFLMFENRGGKL